MEKSASRTRRRNRLHSFEVAATALCALNAAGCEPEYPRIPEDPHAQITQLARSCMDHVLPGYLPANFVNTHLRPWRQCTASQTPSTIIAACNTAEIMQELLQALNRCLAESGQDIWNVACRAWPDLNEEEEEFVGPVISVWCEDEEGLELARRDF